MATKIAALRILTATLFLLCIAGVLYAQSGGYYLDENSRFIQRFVWRGDRYALRYEVIFEREERGAYRPALREFTDDPFIEVSLPPGRYRLRVIPYDFRDLPGEGSDWKEFEILAALRPELNSFSPPSFSMEHDAPEDALYTLDVFGTSLASGAEFLLRNTGGEPAGLITLIDPVKQTDSIVPVESDIARDGSRARLVFAHGQLVPGAWEIRVRNPGGLEARIDGFAINYIEPPLVIAPEPEPPAEPLPVEPEDPPAESVVIEPEPEEPEAKRSRRFDLYTSLAWMPLIPVYKGESPLFENGSALGAGFRFGMVSSNRQNPVNLGVELAASWFSSGADYNGDTSRLHAISLDVNMLVRKWLPNGKMALNFRIGGGISALVGNEEIKRALRLSSNNLGLLHVNIGLSFLWQTSGLLYFEGGLEHAHHFTHHGAGALRPWIGIGLRF